MGRGEEQKREEGREEREACHWRGDASHASEGGHRGRSNYVKNALYNIPAVVIALLRNDSSFYVPFPPPSHTGRAGNAETLTSSRSLIDMVRIVTEELRLSWRCDEVEVALSES